MINKKLEGRSANEILEYAGIPCNGTIKLIVAETERIHPFVTLELLMPLVPLVKAADFEEALEIALDVEQGYKHTATIHSESIEHLNQAAKEMQTSVFVKNGPSFMGIGFDKEGHTSLQSQQQQEKGRPQQGISPVEEMYVDKRISIR